jgi:hypothetical protein
VSDAAGTLLWFGIFVVHLFAEPITVPNVNNTDAIAIFIFQEMGCISVNGTFNMILTITSVGESASWGVSFGGSRYGPNDFMCNLFYIRM